MSAATAAAVQSQELSVISQYRVLSMDQHELGEIMRENMADGLSPFDLDRIKVPSGGGLTWEVATIDGVESVKELEGVIIYWKDNRSYWAEKFSGANSPPDCYSDDGKFGFGNPGGECSACPYAQFGSAVDEKGNSGKGQACKCMRMLFVVGKENVLPSVVVVPPTSLKPLKQYFMRLASKGIPYYGVVTKFTLEKTKSATGISYSKIVAGVATVLTKEQAGGLKAMSDSMRVVLSSVRASREDVGNGDY